MVIQAKNTVLQNAIPARSKAARTTTPATSPRYLQDKPATVTPRSGLTCYKDCESKYYTYTLCLDFEDKSYVSSTGGSICGFNALIATTGDNKTLNVPNLAWEGEATGHYVERCLSVESESPTIVYNHLPHQSNLTCGYATADEGLVSCEATLTTDGLRQTKSESRGAYIDYTYEANDYSSTHKISVSYRCGKGMIYSAE